MAEKIKLAQRYKNGELKSKNWSDYMTKHSFALNLEDVVFTCNNPRKIAAALMKIFVKAKPNAKKESVEKINDTHFIVAVKEPPIKGRANAAIAKNLAARLGVSFSRVRLVGGFSAKQKAFEILM